MGRHNPRIIKPGQCPACRKQLQPEETVIKTRSGSIACEEHAWMFISEFISYRGPYREAKKS